MLPTAGRQKFRLDYKRPGKEFEFVSIGNRQSTGSNNKKLLNKRDFIGQHMPGGFGGDQILEAEILVTKLLQQSNCEVINGVVKIERDRNRLFKARI